MCYSQVYFKCLNDFFLFIFVMSNGFDFIVFIMVQFEFGMIICVLVVDDYLLMCIGFVVFINSQFGMDVVVEVLDGEEVIEVYEDVWFDIVLMDLCMFGMGGVEVMFVLCKKFFDVCVIVFLIYDFDEDIYCVIQLGVRFYFLKDMFIEDIVGMICVVY